MLKHLLATTAIVAVSGAAMAADDTAATEQRPAAQHEIMYLESAVVTDQATAGEHLASYLIGETVYSSHDEDAEAIGEVNDLVVQQDGTIHAVVIGVGGFLGVGEKNVAVNFESIEWTADENGNEYAVLNATQEQLENAPTYDVSVLQPGANAAQMASEQHTDDQMATEQAMADDADRAENEQAMAEDSSMDGEQPADDAPMMSAVPGNLQDVDTTTVSANELIDTTVYGADDANVGEVGDVLLNDGGVIDAVIIDVGGFLGIGEKPVAIAFEDLQVRRDENETIYVFTTFTQDQFDSAPQYDESAYDAERDTMRLSNRG